MLECKAIEKFYDIVSDESPPATLRVKLDFPQRDGDWWQSTVTIDTPDGVTMKPVPQVDSLRALFNGLWMMRMYLEFEKDTYGLWDTPDFWPRGVFDVDQSSE